MYFRLFGAKPVPKPMLVLLSIGPLGTNCGEIVVKYESFHFTKVHLKYRMRNGGHFVQER